MTEKKKTYLILADGSEEFMTAMHYACVKASQAGAHIAILHVTGDPGFQHWGDVEQRMKAEQMAEAERFLKEVQDRIFDLCGIRATGIVEEGKTSEAVLKVLESDLDITKLILAGSTNPSGPGPLIDYFTGKGMEQLNVTLTIVPGHLTSERIEQLV